MTTNAQSKANAMCNEYLIELEKERRAMQDGFDHLEYQPKKERNGSKYAIPFYFLVIFISAFLLGFYVDSLSKVIGG